MSRREDSKMETRRLIMDAARKMLLEKDLAECTMRNIAKRAGVSAASVVVHFKNKGFLLEAALTEDIERNTLDALATLPAEGHLAERLTHIWRTMFSFYDDKRDLYRVLIRSTVFEPESQTPYMTAQTVAFLRFLTELIRSEQNSGRIQDRVDAEVLAEALFTNYFGVLIMFYRNPGMTPEDATGKVLAMNRLTLAGVAIQKQER